MDAPRARFDWASAPKLAWPDLVAMAWAERVLVLSVGAAVLALAIGLALATPRSYEARGELLVRLGQEYVYQPATGAAGAGATPELESVVNAELQLLRSPEVARRAIRQVGLLRLYPDLRGAPQARREALALRRFHRNFGASGAPRTPSIALWFRHKDPTRSAQALNALLDAYLAYRREVLVSGESDALARQAAEFDARVSAASDGLSAFLAEHGIGDFQSELTATAQRLIDTEAQLMDARSKRSEAEGRAAALRARYDAEPEETVLYSESDARRVLVQLQLEREQLLARYQPDAPPVREIDRRIAQLGAFLAEGDTDGVTRRGLNPLHQDIAGQLYGVEAEMRAQRARENELTVQRNALSERLRALQQLEPRYRQLARQRTIFEENAQSFAVRAEERRAIDQLLGRSTDNISIVERAVPPSQGRSLRWPIAIIGLLLAGVLSLAAGVGRALWRRGFPTPASAARTLKAPVLAVTPAAAPSVAQTSPRPSKARLKVLEGGR